MRVSRLLILAFLVLIISCTPTQRPLKNGQGYVVVPVSENQFRIEYYLKYADQIERQWNTTAGQLCLGGYQVVYGKRHILNFDMYVPIAGNDVNIGRQEYIQHGEVVCGRSASSSIILSESKWNEFNAETQSIKPVSEYWLRETLKLDVSHLPDLPIDNPVESLANDWGKPYQQAVRENEVLLVWMKGGDSWFPNQIGLLEQKHCLTLIILLPGVSSVIIGSLENYFLRQKNIESLIINGALPVYFYRPEPGCDLN